MSRAYAHSSKGIVCFLAEKIDTLLRILYILTILILNTKYDPGVKRQLA